MPLIWWLHPVGEFSLRLASTFATQDCPPNGLVLFLHAITLTLFKSQHFVFLSAFFQTAIIIAKLASWGKVSLSESDLNYFLLWVKSGLASTVSASSIPAVA